MKDSGHVAAMHVNHTLKNRASAKSGENQADLQFSDESIRAAIAAVFGRAPRFWAAVEGRITAAELVPVEREALEVVEGMVCFAAERLVAHRGLHGQAQALRTTAVELRQIAYAFATMEGLRAADMWSAQADAFDDRADQLEALSEDAQAPWRLTRLDLMQRDSRLVWSPGQPPLTDRKHRPRWADKADALDTLASVLALECATPECSERPRDSAPITTVINRKLGERRPRLQPICCGFHSQAREGRLEPAARERIADLLKDADRTRSVLYRHEMGE
jgi:hypothetical protein